MPGDEPRRPFWNRGAAPGPTRGSATPGPMPLQRPHRPGHGINRPGKHDEIPLESIAPDHFARLTLALLRWHFQTFATPDTQGWLTALRCATTHVGPREAGPLCYDLVAVLQVLRATRQSPLRFNPEGCVCCRVWLTPEERQIMDLLDHLRYGRTGRARTVAQLLCDGTPADDLIAMAEIYLRRHAPGPVPAPA